MAFRDSMLELTGGLDENGQPNGNGVDVFSKVC